ncbi:hypothetical protein [Ruthenibacterium lactatiformans]|uniref:hypothetical protein n=1 Tax=Ruthenibacterium lactatiformans TaxID=1550024 RepID=UPI0026751EC3|nr:hypothetical protein [Ruthenibacterium lactatiformans]
MDKALRCRIPRPIIQLDEETVCSGVCFPSERKPRSCKTAEVSTLKAAALSHAATKRKRPIEKRTV